MIKETSEVFMTYGWPGIIALAIVAILVSLATWLIKKDNKNTGKSISEGFSGMTKVITEQNDKLLSAILTQNETNNKMITTIVSKSLDDAAKHNSEIHVDNRQRRIDVSKIIKSKVRYLLNKYNCDRTYILEFHNGKENLSGLSFLWYDMLYESVAKGVKPLHYIYRDQDISMLLPIIDDVNNNGGFKIFTSDELESIQKSSSTLYRKLRIDRQVEEAIIVGLYSETNMLLGFLVLEYEESFIPVEILDTEDIVSQGAAISALLDCPKDEKQ